MPDFSAVTASALGFSASGCLVSGEGFADCGSFGSCAAEGWGAAGDGEAAGLPAEAGFPLGAAAGVPVGACLPAKKAVASSREANVSLTSTVMGAPVLEGLREGKRIAALVNRKVARGTQTCQPLFARCEQKEARRWGRAERVATHELEEPRCRQASAASM